MTQSKHIQNGFHYQNRIDRYDKMENYHTNKNRIQYILISSSDYKIVKKNFKI